MFALRLLRVPALTLGLTLAAAAAARAEPNAPIPQPARDRYDQGQALEKQGKYKEAIEAYQEAINLGMQLFPRAHLKEARAYLELKEYDAALARFTKFIDGFGLEDSCRY
jgi:tetratricopeptide (TPR) repeat protein